MIRIAPLSERIAAGPVPDGVERCGDLPTLAVEWDGAPGCLWTLRLCEYFGVQDARWDYPPAVAWKRSGDGELGYADHPVSADSRVKGSVSVSAKIDADALRFAVTLRNDSDVPWRDAWGWICLIHRWAPAFQSNCELPAGEGDVLWRPCVSLDAPRGRWLKWCPVLAHHEAAERIGRHQGRLWQEHIHAKKGAVRAWRMDLDRPVQQFIELSSEQAVFLGWSHWPCTDMGLYFGSLKPGATGQVNGTLRFYEEAYERI